MTQPREIKWPYGFTGTPRPDPEVLSQGVPRPQNHSLENLVAALNDASETERREFMTWLRQMMDQYGYDSAAAIERGIEQEPDPPDAKSSDP